jgi:hypothetical protein
MDYLDGVNLVSPTPLGLSFCSGVGVILSFLSFRLSAIVVMVMSSSHNGPVLSLPL